MREIKFKGYVPQYLGMKGYFVYGLLVRKIDDVCTISSNNKFYVVPCETIGQFTGLHDKNGKEIYEGDIVEYPDYSQGIMIIGKQPKARKVVSWDDKRANYNLAIIIEFNSEKHEILGNIHDKGEVK